jgi:hypothetical protein
MMTTSAHPSIGCDPGMPEGIHAAIAAVNNAMLESAKNSKRGKRKKKARAEQGRFTGALAPLVTKVQKRAMTATSSTGDVSM